MTLTTTDLGAALDDERHLGWGLAGIRREREVLIGHVSNEVIAEEVIAAANARGWDREQLFHFSNSNLARYAFDASVASSDRERVRLIFADQMDKAERSRGVLDGTSLGLSNYYRVR